MAPRVIKTSICCICGKTIDGHGSEEAMSMDHVPPKQFYPKQIRRDEHLNLWCVPTHKRCNEDYRKDEEYFYHAMFAAVQENNQRMGKSIHGDLKRRSHRPQTQAMMRNILRDVSRITEGGIHLPTGMFEVPLDEGRVNRVVIKIVQGLFYLDHQRYLPQKNCVDLHLCLADANVPEFYTATWQFAEVKAVYPDVFSYRHVVFEDSHFWSLLFWKALMFCTEFRDPGKRDS